MWGQKQDDLPTTIQDTSTTLVALPDSQQTIQLHIEDTCAADAFHSTRVKQYSKAHCVAITFPLDRREVLEEMNNEVTLGILYSPQPPQKKKTPQS